MLTVTRSQSRTTAQVRLTTTGQVYEAPLGTPLAAFIQQAEQDAQTPPYQRAVAVLLDNRLRELTFAVTRDLEVKPITLQDSDGTRIYRRSLFFLLVAAAHRTFPNAKVVIDHALPQRAYYCHIEDHPPLTSADLDGLRQTMRQMVDDNTPILPMMMSLEEAKAYFAARGDHAKVRLLQFRTRNYLRTYTLGDFSDYFFGYMVPSTGYLPWFDLQPAENGFLLLYPDRQNPNMVRPLGEDRKIDAVFRQTAEWLKLLGVRDIGQLNESIQNGRLQELILVTEALHERRISEIGQQIAIRNDETDARLILIAGPSSSGKTTFSKRLAIQLMTHSLKPFTLELDNYFVDRHKTPLDEKGEYDFESLFAIDLDKLNSHLQALLAGKVVQLPRFDFHSGQSVAGREIQLSKDHVIILEGIHGLNPQLTPAIDMNLSYRIYVSALTQLNIDRNNRVSTTDVRLLRRIVRDAQHRGWTATNTLERWESVGRGERRNIFPYQELADAMFNSSLVYELAVMRTVAEPHLLRVNLDHPKWAEANRLLSFLSWVTPAPYDGVPDNSLLREFIGGSIFHDFHPQL